ncbi:hypothetical protein Hanom_Chr07g00628721 [Helianthus anomalus]
MEGIAISTGVKCEHSKDNQHNAYTRTKFSFLELIYRFYEEVNDGVLRFMSIW